MTFSYSNTNLTMPRYTTPHLAEWIIVTYAKL